VTPEGLELQFAEPSTLRFKVAQKSVYSIYKNCTLIKIWEAGISHLGDYYLLGNSHSKNKTRTL
jgi:hypothetical protein